MCISAVQLFIPFVFYSDGMKSKQLSQTFLFKLGQTDVFHYFKQLRKDGADRVLKRRISMIHIKSGIHCSILFQKTPKIVESTEIIKRFAANQLCKKFLQIN